MHKKIAFAGLGLTLLAAPLISSADTLSDLQAQVQALMAQIATLQGQQTGSIVPQLPSTSGLPDDYGTGDTGSGVYCPKLSTTLQRGSRDTITGGQVSELQAFLTDYFNLDENVVVGGYFGNLTHNYVIKFQQQNGLPALGIAGSLTRAKIASVCGTGTPPQSANLSASPTSGQAPLTVYFQGSGSVLTESTYISFGDGTNSGERSLNVYHIYQYPGTYVANLHKDGAKGEVVATATITVGGGIPLANNTRLAVTAPTTVTIGSSYLIQWSHLSGPTLAQIAQAYPTATGELIAFNSNDSLGVAQTIVSGTPISSLGAGAISWLVRPNTNDGRPLPAGTYSIALYVSVPSGGNSTAIAQGNSATFSLFVAPTAQPGITVTAPNGGEQWEIGTMNTITWSPYDPNSGVNSSQDVTAYLVGTTYGSGDQPIVPSGKASIHWEGQVMNEYGQTIMAKPGSYYIKITNKKTGATEVSDAQFTLLPKSVDLKLADSDGPVWLAANGPVAARWTSTGTVSCELHNAVLQSNPSLYPVSVPTSGSAIVVPSAGVGNVTIMCTKPNGTRVFDSVAVNPLSTPASVRVVSPNGGERLELGQPTVIRMMQTGLKSVSVALYKNEQWLEWIAKDSAPPQYVEWTPSGASAGPGDVNQAIYKIYITGQKADGTGYVDDKSDAPFGFAASTVTPSCSITSNKSSYAFGETIVLSWTSQNASSAAWVPLDSYGKDNIAPPSGTPSTSGSASITANVIGNPYVTLSVSGTGGSAQCKLVIPVADPALTWSGHIACRVSAVLPQALVITLADGSQQRFEAGAVDGVSKLWDVIFSSRPTNLQGFHSGASPNMNRFSNPSDNSLHLDSEDGIDGDYNDLVCDVTLSPLYASASTNQNIANALTALEAALRALIAQLGQ